mmetsp:Transcript_534/g.2062  ORF Transcript_534/g.2062 Transcript_534/m.2062 type:complete len:241 (+) Transcript_534:1569-2291(+)
MSGCTNASSACPSRVTRVSTARALGTSRARAIRASPTPKGSFETSSASATTSKPSSAPTAANGTITAPCLAAMRTNSGLDGQNKAYFSPLRLNASRTPPGNNKTHSPAARSLYRFLPETGTAPKRENWLRPGPAPPSVSAEDVSAASRADAATASAMPRTCVRSSSAPGGGGKPKGISREPSASFFLVVRGGGTVRAPSEPAPPRDHGVREPPRQHSAFLDERLDDEPEIRCDRLVVPDE